MVALALLEVAGSMMCHVEVPKLPELLARNVDGLLHLNGADRCEEISYLREMVRALPQPKLRRAWRQFYERSH